MKPYEAAGVFLVEADALLREEADRRRAAAIGRLCESAAPTLTECESGCGCVSGSTPKFDLFRGHPWNADDLTANADALRWHIDVLGPDVRVGTGCGSDGMEAAEALAYLSRRMTPYRHTGRNER